MATARDLLLLTSVLFACGDAGSASDTSTIGTDESGESTVAGSSTSEASTTSLPTTGSGSDTPDMGTIAPPAADYLIIAADPLVEAAQEFADYRTGSGRTVVLARVGEIIGAETDPEAASESIREYVRGYYDLRDPGRPMFLLLIGDADDTGQIDGTTIPTSTYEYTLDSKPGSLWATSDHRYADLDGDDLPELAVGRLPAASPAAVEAYLTKVVSAEADALVGPWNRRINMFASSYGQGAFLDDLIEKLVNAVIDEVSYDFDITMTYGRQDSPYVYIPEQFSDQVYNRINEGSLIVSYLGHGTPYSFDHMVWNGTPYPLLDLDALDHLAIMNRSPILTLIACAMGAFDEGESVSERLLAHPRGPVTVLSSTENSDIYPNTLFVRELGLAVTSERPATAGEAFVRAKQRLLGQQDALRQQIDQAFGLAMSLADLEALRRSHLHMYTLFGDPGLELRYPAPATVTATPSTVTAGAVLDVKVAIPGLNGAQVQLTLESQRSRIVHPLAPVPADGEIDRDEVIAANYAAANDKAVVSLVAPLAEGALETSLLVPADLSPGRYHIKIYADDGVADAIGSAEIRVK